MNQALNQVIRQVQSKNYGKYRGIVADNRDPENLARLRLTIPSLLGETVTGWALPCLPYGGLSDQGFFAVPEVDAQVWVEFEAGELNQPIWTGTFWRPGDVPTEAQLDEPTTRVFKTPGGHRLQFDDAEGEEKVTLHHGADAKLEIDESGTIALSDASGGTITLDASANSIVVTDSNGNTMTLDSAGTLIEDSAGNKVELSSAGITVEGQTVTVKGSQVMLGGSGGEPLIKGQSFLTLFATHMHTCTAPGSPTSPPIPQGEMSTLSLKVTAS